MRRVGVALLCALWTVWCASAIHAAQTNPAPAPAPEQIASDVSSRNIAIESNFTGEHIVLFGTIENSHHGESEAERYDVVVTVRGPRKPVVVRRKERVAGIWVNNDSQTFVNAPGYYAVLSSRPLADVAELAVLNSYGLGFESLKFRPVGKGAPVHDTAELAAFRSAVIRIRQEGGLYSYKPRGVVFVGRNLFRATIDLPANVPAGQYVTEVFLLRKGTVLSHTRSHIIIDKAGFGRFVFEAAFDYPLLYGIIAVIIAITAGLLASALARRD